MRQFLLVLALLVFTLPSPALAVLGGAPEPSTQSDIVHEANYSVHTHSEGPATVREYASGGKVFAVVWSGPHPPNLNALFGTYYTEYQEARPGRVLRNERLVTSHLVIETWGHMRDIHGRAYIPSLVPQGVSLDAIR